MADPKTTSNEQLELASCGAGDREIQAQLFNRCFDKHVRGSDLVWRYDKNPQGAALSALLRAPDGQPVCGFAYSPRRFLSFGDEAGSFFGGQQGDVMTDPDWRKRGIAGHVAKRLEADTARAGFPFNWGFPNRRSASVFTKLGWETVGVIRPWSYFFESGPRARKIRFAEGRLAAARLPLDVWRARAKRKSAATREQGSIEVIEQFPAEVLELSRQVESRFALMVRRDADYLNWRFFEAPSAGYRALAVRGKDGGFAGYVVVQPPAEGDDIGWIVDLLAPEEWACAAALEAGLDYLQKAGSRVARASAVDGSWWQQRLEAWGFLRPKPENHLFVYIYVLDAEHPLLDRARDASTWYLTDGDRDDDPIG